MRAPPCAHGAALPLVCALLALAVLAPLLRPGFVLVHDMVFTPRQPLLPASFGLGSALPRAVPVDAVVGLASLVVPGEVVQRLALAGAVFGAALGAGRLVPTTSTGVRIAAATAYAWNPLVAERLFLGHWTLLLGCAALPWVAAAALRVRRQERGALAGLVLASLPALLSAPGGLLALGVALALAGRRAAPALLALAVALNAPWWVPSLLRADPALSDPAGVAAFAARAENWGGPVLSVLGLGGIWNADVVPVSRANPALPVLTVALVAAALAGLRVLARRWGRSPVAGLAALGATGVLLAVLAVLPGGADLLRWASAHVPGAGLLRDAQKWVAWWALPFALGFALAVETARERVRGRASAAVAAAGALLPIALLPDLAWGGFGRLEPVRPPADWTAVHAVLAHDPRPGDVAVLPLSAFRRFAWNDGRTQLDPAPRFLPRTTITDDSLRVGGVVVGGEDERAARVGALLREDGDLTAAGVGWVLVEHGTPGPLPRRTLARLERVFDGPWLTLYRVPGAVGAGPGGPAAAPVALSWAAAWAVICAALLWRGLPVGRFGLRPRPGTATKE
ncbi:hypothetical protein [Umezawaea beigongshangensis]|uniref:hypothetical protein n=1 Tax=Umezawaea beigongshangensis TaxID=2780383 RepID=UPI0018F1ADEC|nr:hypothetical protein [Umezawaea beigongshangensis]